MAGASMRALGDAGLSLHVPKRLGGHEQGLLAFAVTSVAIARGCSSSAQCHETLAAVPVLQHRVADLAAAVMKTRGLV